MNLATFLSFKTNYYFVKGNVTLESDKYHLIEEIDVDKIRKFSESQLENILEEILMSDGNMLQVKTSIGTILVKLFENWDIIEENVKEFSKNSVCGGYLSMRTSDSYGIAIAKECKLLRQIATDECSAILNGDYLDIEKKLGYEFNEENLYLDFDEDKAYDYFKSFLGFDVSNYEFEIEEVKLYSTEEIKNYYLLNKDYFNEVLTNMRRYSLKYLSLYFFIDQDDNEIYSVSLVSSTKEIFYNTYHMPQVELEKKMLQLLALNMNVIKEAKLDSTQFSLELLDEITQKLNKAKDIVRLFIDVNGNSHIQTYKENGIELPFKKMQKKRIGVELNKIEDIVTVSDYCLSVLCKWVK